MASTYQPWQIVTAGSVAGMTATAVCHPFDTVRTRLQTIAAHDNTWRYIAQMVKKEGTMALYKGFLPPFTAQAAYKAIIFGANHESAKYMPQSLPTWMIYFCSGCFAGSLNSVVVAPVELLRNRSMVDVSTNGHLTITRQVRSIVASSHRGMLGLWKGLGATVLRDGPGSGWYFAAYAAGKQLIGDKLQHPFSTLIAGSAAGLAFWAYALPIDTIKSVIQTSNNHNVGLWQTTKQLMGDGGLARLYRGSSVTFIRGVISASVTLVVFEEMLCRLQR